jgi:hypothetical protein
LAFQAPDFEGQGRAGLIRGSEETVGARQPVGAMAS